MKIEKHIAILKPELESLVKNYKDRIEELIKSIQELLEISSKFDKNWVGQWASHTYNYYTDFTGNRETIVISEDEIQKYIESESGLSIKEIREEISNISKSYREFHDRIVTELSVIKGVDDLTPENELLVKIEKHNWGITPADYIEMHRPSNIFTYDPSVINKGLNIPPHLNINGKLMSLVTTLAAFKEFQKIANRILRQLEIKFSIEIQSSDNIDFVLKIINSFHNVARQIRNRHDGRETIKIKDEYDVQDLFHSLLRVEFDDIRPEEYTPSYAGSSTRVDFLLKNEKIVIEIKMTRNGLKDKEIGNQLILDSQHYKVHPDCKRLICFVYDPENRIENPKGLETDLNNLTDDELIVEVYIRP